MMRASLITILFVLSFQIKAQDLDSIKLVDVGYQQLNEAFLAGAVTPSDLEGEFLNGNNQNFV